MPSISNAAEQQSVAEGQRIWDKTGCASMLYARIFCARDNFSSLIWATRSRSLRQGARHDSAQPSGPRNTPKYLAWGPIRTASTGMSRSRNRCLAISMSMSSAMTTQHFPVWSFRPVTMPVSPIQVRTIGIVRRRFPVAMPMSSAHARGSPGCGRSRRCRPRTTGSKIITNIKAESGHPCFIPRVTVKPENLEPANKMSTYMSSYNDLTARTMCLGTPMASKTPKIQ
eukprot:1366355-Pyramimonas_sp.AAC.2